MVEVSGDELNGTGRLVLTGSGRTAEAVRERLLCVAAVALRPSQDRMMRPQRLCHMEQREQGQGE